MFIPSSIEKILANYNSDSPAVRANLVRILMQGALKGTGKLVILPVDQGFEHGPDKSFARNPAAYDPLYHFGLALEAGLNAYAAPLGMIEVGAEKYAGFLPLILKINSANLLSPKNSTPNQALTGTIKDAIRLGCVGIGLTLYPGSPNYFSMIEKAKDLIQEAKTHGLIAVIWAYARGGDITKEGETATDIISYAAHICCLLGATIVKVKPPTKALALNQNALEPLENLSDRIKIVKQACFAGKRLLVFSGGESKTKEDLLQEISQIKAGGGDGSIIGRNAFQRPRAEALKLLEEVINIYKA